MTKTSSNIFELRFKSLIDSTAQILIEINNLKQISFISKELENICEYQHNQIINQNIINFIHPEDMSYLELLIKNEDTKKIRFKSKNNKFICFDCKSSFFTIDETKHILINMQKVEITDVKELIQSKKFLKDLFDYIPAVIVVINMKNGKYEYVNKALETILGYPPEMYEKDGFWQFLLNNAHPNERDLYIKNNQESLDWCNKNPNNKLVQETEYRMKTTSGDYKHLKSYALIFERDKEGIAERAINITIDITERKEAEEKLKEKNLELERITKFLNELTSNLSHDLKAPINSCYSILNVLSMLNDMEDGLDKNTIKETSNKIRKALTKISESISICLDREMLTVGKVVLKSERVNVKQALEDSFFLYQEITDNRHIDLEFNTTQEDIFILADRIRFEHILSNLIGNALKYTDTFVKVNTNIKNDKILIQIQNNGMTINPDMKDKIFDRYITERQNAIGGTGLGLYICKQYTAMMNGNLWFESNNGLTSFYIEFDII